MYKTLNMQTDHLNPVPLNPQDLDHTTSVIPTWRQKAGPGDASGVSSNFITNTRPNFHKDNIKENKWHVVPHKSAWQMDIVLIIIINFNIITISQLEILCK